MFERTREIAFLISQSQDKWLIRLNWLGRVSFGCSSWRNTFAASWQMVVAPTMVNDRQCKTGTSLDRAGCLYHHGGLDIGGSSAVMLSELTGILKRSCLMETILAKMKSRLLLGKRRPRSTGTLTGKKKSRSETLTGTSVNSRCCTYYLNLASLVVALRIKKGDFHGTPG